MKPCPGNSVHHWLIETKDGRETGTCRHCGAVREFDSEKRWSKFGTEPLAPRKLATLVRTKR